MHTANFVFAIMAALYASATPVNSVPVEDTQIETRSADLEKRASVHVSFFVDGNYGGASQEFYTERNGGCWNINSAFQDKISSIRFPSDVPGWCRFYKDLDCKGFSLRVDSGDALYSMGTQYYNDIFSSFNCF